MTARKGIDSPQKKHRTLVWLVALVVAPAVEALVRVDGNYALLRLRPKCAIIDWKKNTKNKCWPRN